MNINNIFLILGWALGSQPAWAQGSAADEFAQGQTSDPAPIETSPEERLARAAPLVAQSQAIGLGEPSYDLLPWSLLEDSDLLRLGPEIPLAAGAGRSLEEIVAALAHAEQLDPDWQPVIAHRNANVIASYRYLPTGGLYSLTRDAGLTHDVGEAQVPPATVLDARRVHGPIYELGAIVGANHRVGGGHIHSDQAAYRRSPARLVTMIVRIHNEPWYARLYNPGSYPGLTIFERGLQSELRYGVAQFRASNQTWRDFLRWIGPLIFSKNSFLNLAAETLEYRGISPAFNIDQLERREFYLQRLWDSSGESIPKLVEWDVTAFAGHLTPNKANVRAFQELASAELGIDLFEPPYRADFADAITIRKFIQKGSQVYAPRELSHGYHVVDRFFTLTSEHDVAQFLVAQGEMISGDLVRTLAPGFFQRHPDVWNTLSRISTLRTTAFYRAPIRWWRNDRLRGFAGDGGIARRWMARRQTRKDDASDDELRIAMRDGSVPLGSSWLEAIEAIDRDINSAAPFLGREILDRMRRIAEREYVSANDKKVAAMTEHALQSHLGAQEPAEGTASVAEPVTTAEGRAILAMPLGALAAPEHRGQLDRALNDPDLVSFALWNLVGSGLDQADALPLGYISYALRSGKFAECNHLLLGSVLGRLPAPIARGARSRDGTHRTP